MHCTVSIRGQLNCNFRKPVLIKIQKKSNRFSSNIFWAISPPSTINFNIFLLCTAVPPFPLCSALLENRVSKTQYTLKTCSVYTRTCLYNVVWPFWKVKLFIAISNGDTSKQSVKPTAKERGDGVCLLSYGDNLYMEITGHAFQTVSPGRHS